MYNLVFCGPVVQFWLERRPVTAEVAGSSPVRSAINIMFITVLKSKLHRVKVTSTNPDYDGSCGIDLNWMEELGIKEFEQVQKGRSFVIIFGREDEMITEISKKYNDVPTAEKLAIFGENNQLQIAINKGKASQLLGLNLHEIIRIEFK